VLMGTSLTHDFTPSRLDCSLDLCHTDYHWRHP
jgi:hypothetical protein